MRRIRTNCLAGETYMSEAMLPRGRFLQDRPQSRTFDRATNGPGSRAGVDHSKDVAKVLKAT
jgi:hypothetical protein